MYINCEYDIQSYIYKCIWMYFICYIYHHISINVLLDVFMDLLDYYLRSYLTS
jgi:hypothetical protein